MKDNLTPRAVDGSTMKVPANLGGSSAKFIENKHKSGGAGTDRSGSRKAGGSRGRASKHKY